MQLLHASLIKSKQPYTDRTGAMKLENHRFYTLSVTILLAIAAASIVLLPSGASNTAFALVTLATLAHPAFWKNSRNIPRYPALVIALALFALLALSTTWADVTLGESTKILKKYREFLLIPILFIVIQLTGGRNIVSKTLYMSLTLSAIATCVAYLLGTPLNGKSYALHIYIFFSISTSFLAFWATLLAMQSSGRKQVLHIAIIIIALVAILFVEKGRTGYITLLGLGLLLALRGSTPIKSAVMLLCPIVLFALAYGYSDVFQKRIARSINSLEAYYNGGNTNTSTGKRLDFYKYTAALVKKDPVFGSGIGDFTDDYARIIKGTDAVVKTEDPHNEYLMLAAAAGIPATLMFLAFMFFTAHHALRYQKGTLEGELLLGAVVTIFLSCLFNSSMLAHRDGAFFMLLIALFMLPSVKASIQKEIADKGVSPADPFRPMGM